MGAYGSGTFGGAPLPATPADQAGGEGAFDPGAFDSGAFNTGAFNTQVLNGGGIRPDPRRAGPPSLSAAAPVHDSVNVSEPAFRAVDVALVKIHVSGLIAAFEEIEEYHPGRNVSPPPLWKNDKGYLDDIRALLVELRRLNDLIEAGKLEPAKVTERKSAIVHAATKISNAAYDTIGKGIGATILCSIGLLAYQLGAAPEIVQVIVSGTKGK